MPQGPALTHAPAQDPDTKRTCDSAARRNIKPLSAMQQLSLGIAGGSGEAGLVLPTPATSGLMSGEGFCQKRGCRSASAPFLVSWLKGQRLHNIPGKSPKLGLEPGFSAPALAGGAAPSFIWCDSERLSPEIWGLR